MNTKDRQWIKKFLRVNANNLFWDIVVFFMIFQYGLIGPAYSQTPHYENLHLNKKYVQSYFSDARDIAIAPVKWKKKQWIGFAAFTGVTVLIYTQDESIRNYFLRNQTEAKDNISKNVIEPMGSYYLAGFLGGMYVYGLLAKDQNTESTALLTGKAVILTGAYTFLFKNIFQRERPYESVPADPGYWGGPFDGFNHNSFPSGHTSVAFAAATVLSACYKEHLWVGLTAYSVAGLVAVSRIYEDQHWASDVFAGAALGYAIGRLVYNKNEARRLKVMPFGSSLGSGVTFTYSLN